MDETEVTETAENNIEHQENEIELINLKNEDPKCR